MTTTREEVQDQGGRGGVGAGRGGRRRGGLRKQEVDTETHGALEFHLLEINEKEEGGESSGPGLGETVIIAIISIASLVFLCIISGCVFMMWKCGLCPEGRRRRRTSLRSSTTGSRKRPHDSEDSELGELRLKLRKLEAKSAKKEEEQEKKEKKEKELEMKEEETSKRGLRAITTEVGSLPEMDEMETVSMEDYNRRLDQATKLIKDIEKARMVVNHHKENIKLGVTLGYIGGAGAGGR